MASKAVFTVFLLFCILFSCVHDIFALDTLQNKRVINENSRLGKSKSKSKQGLMKPCDCPCRTLIRVSSFVIAGLLGIRYAYPATISSFIRTHILGIDSLAVQPASTDNVTKIALDIIQKKSVRKTRPELVDHISTFIVTCDEFSAESAPMDGKQKIALLRETGKGIKEQIKLVCQTEIQKETPRVNDIIVLLNNRTFIAPRWFGESPYGVSYFADSIQDLQEYEEKITKFRQDIINDAKKAMLFHIRWPSSHTRGFHTDLIQLKELCDMFKDDEKLSKCIQEATASILQNISQIALSIQADKDESINKFTTIIEKFEATFSDILEPGVIADIVARYNTKLMEVKAAIAERSNVELSKALLEFKMKHDGYWSHPYPLYCQIVTAAKVYKKHRTVENVEDALKALKNEAATKTELLISNICGCNESHFNKLVTIQLEYVEKMSDFLEDAQIQSVMAALVEKIEELPKKF